MVRRILKTLMVSTAVVALTLPLGAAEPDWTPWTEILEKYYSPANGMDYGGIRKSDFGQLAKLVHMASLVDTSQLNRNERLAYWMNLYNISTVKLIVDNYPTESIRDLSTDPIVRLNVFKKEIIPLGDAMVSLNWVEHEKIRKEFEDPRIHFAINCAAKSCPPMRPEAFVGDKVEAQLEDQATKFVNANTSVSLSGSKATITVTKIMDWFDDDFEDWGGGIDTFVSRYLTGGKKQQLSRASSIKIKHHDYDWTLNDWKR